LAPTPLDATDWNPLAGAPGDLLSLAPNDNGWFNCVAVLEAAVLPNGFAAGGAAGVDELFGSPKPNTGFDVESDAAGAAGGLDGVTLIGLPVSPKLNFGFSTSPVPLAGRVLALGLGSLLVGFGGLEGCENEKKLGVVFEPFPCGADETFEVEVFDGAFGCPKEKNEEFVELFASGTDDGAVVGCELGVKKLGTVGLDEIVPLAAGVGAEVKLERVGLDGAGPLAAGVDAGVCVAGIGAEGKENKVPGAVAGVLPSDLSFASLGCELEDSVGILNNGGGLGGSVFCELPFENGGRENAGVVRGGATEGLSSDFADRTVGKVGAVATFFASASLASAPAFVFSFSSALHRRRAIASASISCFSHFEYELDGRNLGLISVDFTAWLVYNDEMRRVYWGGGARGNNAIRGLAIKEWFEMRILRTGLPVFDVEAQRSCLPALDEFRYEKSDQLERDNI